MPAKRSGLIALAAILGIAAVLLVVADTAPPSAPAVTARAAGALAPPADWKLAFSRSEERRVGKECRP